MYFNQRVKFTIIATIIINIVFFSTFCFSKDRFIDNKNGTIRDNTTGLMWSKKIKHTNKEYHTMNYKKIMDYVKNYKTGGYDDWRLPTIKELRTICLTSCYRYPFFYYQRECKGWAKGASSSFRTSDKIAPNFLMYEYTPFADAVTIENKYSVHHYGYWKIVRLVRGSQKTIENNISLPGKYHTFNENEKVSKIIKSDGFVYYKTYGYGYKDYSSYIIPTDITKWKLLTYCPMTAFAFVKHWNPNKIRGLPIEQKLKENKVNKINLWEIKGFNEYYEKFLKYDKFEMAEKKDEIYDKLIECWKPYREEYDKFLKSTFILTPFPSYKELKKDDYNVDNETLTINRDGQVVNSKLFYSAQIQSIANGFQNKYIPYTGECKFKMPLKEAATMFKNHKRITYTNRLYIKPNLETFYYPFDYCHGFDIRAIVYEFWDADKNEVFMMAVLHDFKPILNKNRRKTKKYKWKTEFIRF